LRPNETGGLTQIGVRLSTRSTGWTAHDALEVRERWRVPRSLTAALGD
jgi:hypothetical protein